VQHEYQQSGYTDESLKSKLAAIDKERHAIVMREVYPHYVERLNAIGQMIEDRYIKLEAGEDVDDRLIIEYQGLLKAFEIMTTDVIGLSRDHHIPYDHHPIKEFRGT
jgi:hypothetical protein